MNRPTSPCTKCKDRTEECHATCKPYKFYQAEQEIYRDFMHKQNSDNWIDHTPSRDRRRK